MAQHYVRPYGGSYGLENGSDYDNAWDGFADITWGSIAPGDTLYVAGTHSQLGGLAVGASGTAGNPITIASCTLALGASTDDPGTIWGGRLWQASTGWAKQAEPNEHVYLRTGVSNVTANLVVDALLRVLTPKTSIAEVEAAENSFYYNGSGSIWYRPTDADGLQDLHWNNTYTLDINEKSYITVRGLTLYMEESGKGVVTIFRVSDDTTPANNITIDDCIIRFGVDKGVRCAAASAADCANIAVTNCTIIDCAAGFYHTANQGDAFTITGNEFYHTSNMDVSVYNRTFGDCCAIALGTGGATNSVVTDNWIHDWRGEGIFLFIAAGGNLMTNNLVARNVVEMDSADGLHSNMGIILSSENTATPSAWAGTVVANNLITGAHYNAAAYAASAYTGAFRLKLGVVDNPADRVQIINNTVYDSWCGCYNRVWPGYASAFVFENNIISTLTSGGYFHYWENTDGYAQVTTDYNCYHGTGKWKFDGGADLSTFAGWCAASGESSSNSLNDNPLFSVAGTDFTLQGSSPCRDTGTDTGLTTDLAGDVRPVGSTYDMGAYEYQEVSAQIARPTADITTTGWIAVPTGNPYSCIDEAFTALDDADYCYSNTPGSVLQVGLEPLTDPLTDYGAYMRYRGAGTYTVRLFQSDTVTMAVRSHVDVGLTTHFELLTPAEVALITDWEALSVAITAG